MPADTVPMTASAVVRLSVCCARRHFIAALVISFPTPFNRLTACLFRALRYAPPEAFLGCGPALTASPAVDIWAVGAVLADLLGRRPLLPGRDYIDQLKVIVSVVGKPSEEDFGFVRSQKARDWLAALPTTEVRCLLDCKLQNCFYEAET